MEIRTLPISELNPAPYNPRKDLKPGDHEYERLKKSIETFDLVEPVVWNKRTGHVVGGHQRLKIIKARGDENISVSVVDLDDKQEAALNVALNKIAGEWDIPKLKDLLGDLDDGHFDLSLTGFDGDDLEKMLQGVGIFSANAIDPPDLADGDREPFQQMTFTLHDEQAETIKSALEEAKRLGPFDGPNANSNGNALARIAEAYCGGR